MKAFLVTACTLLLFTAVKSQNFSITASVPAVRNFLVSDSETSVQAAIFSKYELNAVIAAYGARRDTLQFAQNTSGLTQWTGVLRLQGLRDTVKVKIIASDYLNNKDSSLTSFVYAPLPRLIIPDRHDILLANPTVKFKARCVDTLYGCSVIIGGKTYPDSAEVTIDLTPQEGVQTCIPVAALSNKYKQQVSTCLPVYVGSNPNFTFLRATADKIYDFNFGRILSAQSGITNDMYPINYLYNLKLTDLADGKVEEISFNGRIPISLQSSDWENLNRRVWLAVTPYGAIFSGTTKISDSNPTTVLDWNRKMLFTVSKAQVAYGFPRFSANRKHAIWQEYYPGFTRVYVGMRNLELQKDTVLENTLNFAGGEGEISSSGQPFIPLVEYVPMNGLTVRLTEIYTIKNGVYQKLTNLSSAGEASSTITNGNQFLFQSVKVGSSQGLRVIVDSAGKQTVLAGNGAGTPFLSSGPFEARSFYQINSGYIVFLRPNTTQVYQVWLKDSTGAETQLSRFGTASSIECLAENGDVIFINSGTRYISDRKGNSRELGSAATGKIYNVDGHIYLGNGNILFEINRTIVPNKVNSFSRTPLKDSVYEFKLDDFSSNFSGSGSLLNIKIVQLPASGKLLLNNVAVVVNAEISRVNIDQLKYVANASLTARDSIGWMGKNAIGYAEGTASVFFEKPLAPARPITSKLDTLYCATSATLKIKILNLPDISSGNIVTGSFNNTLLTLASDSSFTIDLTTISSGVYRFALKYSNTAGSDSLLALITIKQPIAPKLQLTSSDTAVTASGLVTITATNVQGGGLKPDYTFALDRQFSAPLRPASDNNVLLLQGSALNTGYSWVYGRMKTSETCTLSETGIDSVRILKTDVATGLIDIDFQSSLIIVYPNPAYRQFSIKNLQSSKKYQLVLYSVAGKQVGNFVVATRNSWTSPGLNVHPGNYILRMYDLTKKRDIGSLVVRFR